MPKQISAKLSTCAEKYIAFKHDPFSSKDVPCVPKDPAQFVRTIYIRSAGTLSTGGANFGFIAIDPLNACHNDPQVINGGGTPNGWVVYSDPAGTYAGSVTSLSGAGVLTDSGNSDYVVASFGIGGQAASARVVGAGVRVKYRGTELERGGSILAFHDPQHESIINRTYASINGDDLRLTFEDDWKWKGVTWSIADDSDEKPVPDANFFGGTLPNTTADGCYPMGIVIEAPPGHPGIFDWEAVCGLEVIGRNIRGKRLSNADPVGHNAASVAGMIPGMNKYHEDVNIAPVAVNLAKMHVASQSAPYYPPGQVQKQGVGFEDALEKALSFGVDHLPEVLGFLGSILI